MYFRPETQQVFTTHSEVRSAFPNVSFPVDMTEELMSAFGVFPVTQVSPSYNHATQEAVELKPILNASGSYEQKWEIKELSAEAVAALKENQWASIRSTRDSILTTTDWIVIKALEAGTQVPAEWLTYRQSIRDITTQTDPFNITWPVTPINP